MKQNVNDHKPTELNQGARCNEETTPQIFDFNHSEFSSVSLGKILFSLSTKSEICFLFLGILGACGGGVSLNFISYLSGPYLNEGTTNTSNADIESGAALISYYYIIVGSVAYISSFAMMTMTTMFGKRVGNRYKVKYLEMVLQLPQKSFDLSHGTTHELSNQMLQEGNIIANGIGPSLGNCFFFFGSIIAGFTLAGVTNWKYSLILGCGIPIVFIVMILLLRFVDKTTQKQSETNAKVSGKGEEVLYKIKTVASFSNYEYEKKEYLNSLNYICDLGLTRSKTVAASGALVSVVYFLSGVFSLSYGSFAIYKEHKDNKENPFTPYELYSVGMLIGFVLYQFNYVVPTIRGLSFVCSNAKLFFAIKRYRDSACARENKENPIASNIVRVNVTQGTAYEIRFNNVSFAYTSKNKSTNVFMDGSLVIPPRRGTCIGGESGCGKSTLINGIERIYAVDQGAITGDGGNISTIDIGAYRDYIGFVGQEPVGFNDTIRNNVIFGRENISDGDIIRSGKQANIWDFVHGGDTGGDYEVGVKGGKLSGGQKQRIAIARALLKQPKILILDEATSALDTESEKEIIDVIHAMKKNITIIFISHRISTVKIADNIVLLGKGKGVLEQGSLRECLARKGKVFEIILKHSEINYKDDSTTQENTGEINQIIAPTLQSKHNSCYNETEEKPGLHADIQQISKSNFGKIMNILNAHKVPFYSGLFFSVLSGVIFPIGAMIYAAAFDSIIDKDNETVRKNGLTYGGYFIGIVFVAYVVDFVKAYSFETLGEHLCKVGKERIFNTYGNLHMSFFDVKSNSPGHGIGQMISKTNTVNSIVMSIFGIGIQSISTIVTSSVIGIIYDWRITGINICFLAFIMLINGVYLGFLKTEEKFDNNADYSEIISESVGNTVTIFAFNAQKKMVDLLNTRIGATTRKLVRRSVLNGFIYGFTVCFSGFEYAAVGYAVGKFYVKSTITIGNFGQSFLPGMDTTYKMAVIIKYQNDINKMYLAVNDGYALINTKSEIDPSTPAGKAITTSDNFSIDFKDVSFAYPTNKEKLILKSVSFTINKGEIVGFIGESGSGKSTIVQGMERFYDVNEGEILVNSVNVKEYRGQDLRKVIGLVQQEPMGFTKSVYENIKYGDMKASDEEVVEIAKLCKIDFKLDLNAKANQEKQPAGSGGEKQRVAIARALIKKPRILGLDEPTSALDQETENDINDLLYRVAKTAGITMIIIAHRLSTLRHCDRCYRVKNGKVQTVSEVKS